MCWGILFLLYRYNIWCSCFIRPVPGAARSQTYVCCRSPTEIVGSNPPGSMDVFIVPVQYMVFMLHTAGTRGRGVLDVRLRPLPYWDCGFESPPPGAWMFFCCECCVLSGRGLWDELITRPEESYRLWCVVVCDLETSGMSRPWPNKGCRAKNKLVSYMSGYSVVQLVESLRYKLEGRVFDSRWCHWNFSLTQSFRPHYSLGVDSASNRNQY